MKYLPLDVKQPTINDLVFGAHILYYFEKFDDPITKCQRFSTGIGLGVIKNYSIIIVLKLGIQQIKM